MDMPALAIGEGRPLRASSISAPPLRAHVKTTWIFVADSSRDKVLETRGAAADVREIEEFIHPEGRAHNRDLKTDGPGRYFGKGEQTQAHTATTKVEPQEHEAELFAKKLTDHLDKARTT